MLTGGRGTPENVTSPATEPKGPRASRSATMRAASAGPMPGNASNAAESARSASTGPTRAADGAIDGARPGAIGRPGTVGALRPACRAPARCAKAESTAASCAASARASPAPAWVVRVSHPRTAVPTAVTRAR